MACTEPGQLFHLAAWPLKEQYQEIKKAFESTVNHAHNAHSCNNKKKFNATMYSCWLSSCKTGSMKRADIVFSCELAVTSHSKLLLDYILHSCSPERTQGPTDCCLTFNTRLKTTGKSCFSWDVDRMCSRVVFVGIYLREVGVQFGPHAKEHLRSVLFSEPVLQLGW